MNSLSDYIVERIRIDNIKLKFPVDGTPDDIIDFLNSNNFSKVKYDYRSYIPDYIDAFKHGVRGYEYDNNTIIFADMSLGKQISKSNPLWYMWLGKYRNEYKKCTDSNHVELLSDEEFINEINKYFNSL